MSRLWWKKQLSYFTEVHIESVDSDLNPGLHLCLSQGRYQLCVENAIYSYEDKYDNFRDTFSQIDLSEYYGKKILILGFGMGSIPILLEKDPKFHAEFSCVEYDESVIYLFQKYLAEKVRSRMEFFVTDAKRFIEVNAEKYDMIAMDVFIEDRIPAAFKEVEFIELLRDSLSENGLLIWNHLYHYEKDRTMADEFFEDKFLKTFPNGSFFRTQGNKMLLNKKIVTLPSNKNK